MDHSVLPLPRKNRRLSMGFFFCRDYVFQFTTTDGLYGSQYRRLFVWYYAVRWNDWGSFSTGSSTGPRIPSSPPFSPNKEPLLSFQRQDVQPSLDHPATKPDLLGTNALRCAIVDSHGSYTFHCCRVRWVCAPPVTLLLGWMLPFLLLLVYLLPLTLLLGSMLPLFLQLVRALCCPFFCSWCRRYADRFTAVGICAVLHTSNRVDAAPSYAVGVGILLPSLLRLAYVLSFTLLIG